MNINLNIPRISDEPLPILVEAGDRLFIVGANGSGKSALIQHLVSTNQGEKIKRISAHRQTWFQSGSIDLTPHRRKQFDQNSTLHEVQDQARWLDYQAQQRQEAVLFDLVAKENTRARLITNYVDNKQIEEAKISADKEESPFDQLNELLAIGTLSVTIENSKDEGILARYRDSDVTFSMAQMSDGERNAALIAAHVLTVEPGTVLLIDEPERHLHRSIIEPFLSALFQKRTDCAFVISTHEITLPLANPEARVLIVRSCEWEGEKPIAWDIQVLEKNVDLPEDLKRAILGSRKRILFVEGDSDSLDLPLYDALFPNLSVVPKGSATDVEKAVKGLRGSDNLHHVEAFGLIDRDDRSDDKVTELEQAGVFALNVYSVESLYYCSDSLNTVAHLQAKSLGKDANAMRETAKKKVLNVLKQDGLAERMAAKRCERRVRNQLLSRLPDWETIKTNNDSPIKVCVPSPFLEELKRFKNLVANENLDDLVALYPLRESPVFSEISKALELTNKTTYKQTLLTRIRNDATLAENLKQRIGPLSKVLTNESTASKGSES